MTESLKPPAQNRAQYSRGDTLADVLERVLDKGIVIAGDIRVNLLDIELLTIRIRLLITSADKAQELGMAWWRNDPFFTGIADAPPATPLPEQGATDDAPTTKITISGEFRDREAVRSEKTRERI
jgi:hypothetical protein